MQDVVILAAKRTAIGKFGGSLAAIPAADLGAKVIKSLIEQLSLPIEAIDQVLLGHVLTAGCGQNPARQASLRAGLPHGVPAVTIGVSVR